MRVSSLSNAQVIDLISKYFVPAWVSRDSYQLEFNKQQQAELQRIDRDRHQHGFEGGTVCVFVLDPEGNVRATLRVQAAYKPENLIPFLEKIIADDKLTPRKAEAIEKTAAKAAEAKPKTEGGRFVHIWTRVDLRGNNRGLTNDRVELSAAEGKAFAPPADAKTGDSWKIADDIAAKLYQYGYPPGPHWQAKDAKVLRGTLTATLASQSAKEVRVKLEGEMELSFPHTGKPTDGKITARFVGVAKLDRKKQALVSLELVSQQADYVWYWEGKAQPMKMRIAMELEP
jgi:hypothetical protein